MPETILNDSNFEKEVLESKIPVLVDFWASWCGPCQMMSPIISELAEEYNGKTKVAKLNVEENPTTATQYGIMSIPNIKIFKDGKVVDEFIGVQSKEAIKEHLDKIITKH